MSIFNTVKFDVANKSAFGDLIANEDTALVQLDFFDNVINTYQTAIAATNSATIDQSNSLLRLQSGTNTAGSAIARSGRLAKYSPGQGMKARFSGIFTTGVAGNTQIIGAGTAANGYFFGYNGTTFGILHRNNSSNTWIAQTNWNVDKLNSAASAFILDPTKGNVFQIVYPYLGFGTIFFFVESPSGAMIHVHSIQYPNTATAVQITSANLYFYASNINNGNTTNIITYIGSAVIFLSGKRQRLGTPFGASHIKTIGTTKTSVFTLKNATTFNGSPNYVQLLPGLISWAADNFNGASLGEIWRDATLGGLPSFTPISGSTADNGVTITSGQSCISIDTAGTTLTGGTVIYNAVLARNTNFWDELTDMELFLAPGETWTLSFVGEGNTTARAALNWKED